MTRLGAAAKRNNTPVSSRRTARFGRRAFVYGVGTAGIALPFLEGTPERSAFAQSATTPRFGLYVCTACGVVQSGNGGFGSSDPERFWPSETGELTTASLAADTDRCTGILADYADRLLIVRGVNMQHGNAGCGHAQGLVQTLTAMRVSGSNNNTTAQGPSVDNVVADALGVTSLNLYAGEMKYYITNMLSFRSAGAARAAENNPYRLYQDLTGLTSTDNGSGGGSGEEDSMAARLLARRASVNDLVRDDLSSLLSRPELSKADKDRLDLHFSSLRDLENNMASLGLSCTEQGLSVSEIEAIQNGFQSTRNTEQISMLQMELVALSFACNTTQVAALQVGDGTDKSIYNVNGQDTEVFHHVSHRVNSDGTGGGSIANAVEKHAAIDRIRMESLKTTLDKWAQYDTPGGPLLDNGFIYWTNHVAEGPSHTFNNLPIIVAGSGGGYLKQGAYVDAGGATNGQVLATLANANGVPMDGFGDANGTVPEMLA